MVMGRLLVLSACLLMMVIPDAYAQEGGRIDITPRRIILETRERVGEFTILNIGSEESTVRVTLLNYRQDERGVYATLESPLDPVFDPSEIVRLSPRQFTVPAGGKQKVRFTLRKPADLPAGEYRFHIQVARATDYGPPAPSRPGTKSVGVVVNVGAAIPVVVRHNAHSVDVALSDLSYIPANRDDRPEFRFTIKRQGDISTIGQARIIWIPNGGEAEEIGVSSNLNVFHEVAERHVVVPLKHAPSGHGRFYVEYINDLTREHYADASLQQ